MTASAFADVYHMLVYLTLFLSTSPTPKIFSITDGTLQTAISVKVWVFDFYSAEDRRCHEGFVLQNVLLWGCFPFQVIVCFLVANRCSDCVYIHSSFYFLLFLFFGGGLDCTYKRLNMKPEKTLEFRLPVTTKPNKQ